MNPYHYPPFSLTLSEGQPRIHFCMGMADSYSLLSRRAFEAEFTEIAADDPPPILDTRPKLDPGRPEVRVYRIVFYFSENQHQRLSEDMWLVLP